MKRPTTFTAGLMLVALAVASFTVSPSPTFAQAQAQPQPQLETEMLTIVTGQGSFDFTVEIADEPQERAMGLMFREKMDPKAGMIFDFKENDDVQMWMQNTPLSLDMIFIRKDGTVANIAKRTQPFSTRVIASDGPVTHVLELNAGITDLIGLKPGDSIRHRFFNSMN